MPWWGLLLAVVGGLTLIYFLLYLILLAPVYNKVTREASKNIK